MIWHDLLPLRFLPDSNQVISTHQQGTSIALFYYYPDGKLTYITENGREVARLTYTKQGDFIQRKYYAADEHCTYKYDSHGNWVERIKSERGKPFVIDIREIHYY